MRTHFIHGADGVELFVRDTGPEDAPAIVLIHGWSQHHLCWSRQLHSDLATRFRLIAPDLRGHGASAKPDLPDAYTHSALWAGDIAAIIAELDLTAPLLVGWSMGGWIVSDYLRMHRDDALSGIVLIGTSARTGRFTDPKMTAARSSAARAEGMYSQDQAISLPATIAFVKACVARPLPADELALLVAMNMLCPPHIRHACRTRSEDYREILAGIKKPALIIQGAGEKLCLPAIFNEIRALIPGVETTVYDDCGHAPFWEDAPRFNADLARFAAMTGVAA